jgi:hypothetical protein
MTPEQTDRLDMAVASIAVLRAALVNLVVASPAPRALLEELEGIRPLRPSRSSAFTDAAVDELALLIRRGIAKRGL